VAAGEYDGALRELILAYKERGRRGLAGPLGDTLATTVLAGAGGASPGALVLVPVPCTPAAVRVRQGDHMLRLARRASRRLRRLGLAVSVATPLRALPKPDSAHLDRQARAQAALTSFVVRPRRAAPLAALADVGHRHRNLTGRSAAYLRQILSGRSRAR
jgi:predicted amidophosphoribosyltransferase